MASKDLKYEPARIESKWQKKWEKDGLYIAKNPSFAITSADKKFYLLIEFPYPSGAGLHVGHVRSWSAMDAYARKKRMEGLNVLYPIGWDAFGLPAENYAIKNKIHPSIAVLENIATFKGQIKRLGISFDWSREINTTDPKYYKWTQWIFLKFYEKGMAYQGDVYVNWCPFCKTNLADEEVQSDGTHERCGNQTEKRLQKQWLLRITKYADRLIDDLKTIDYSPRIAGQQVNWIGRKEGINIKYEVKIQNSKFKIQKYYVECFTTRPDTNFGATFIVIGPEHPFVAKLLQSSEFRIQSSEMEKIKDYVEKAKKKSEIDRIAEGRKKTGVFTGFYAINNLNGKKLPIWISDFVLGNVGTGAVVGVPAHDIRDFEFAQEFNLPVIRVVVGSNNDQSPVTKKEQVQEEEGIMTNSEFLNGLDIHKATEKIMDYLEEKGWGKRVVSYHLRDWVFSRQHYWGEPIPIIHCEKCGIVPVPEKDLPVELPFLEKYEPSGTGESPLAKVTDWVNVTCPECKGKAKRETDTMPNWAGSNWYYVRYLDPQNDTEIASKEKMTYFLPVDLYQGGFEHTTLHLLYSRFVYKFLFDCGVVPTPEPYAKRRSHGIVLGSDGRKMSKSFGNVINPDDIVKKFGADTLRVYEMFMGPFDQTIAWSEEGVEGCYKFLKRVWRLFMDTEQSRRGTQNNTEEGLALSMMHKTIKKVTDDIDTLHFNTAVSSMMEWYNFLFKQKQISEEETETFLKLLSPFAPHLTEEVFSGIGKDGSINSQSWPLYDPKLLEESEVTVVVQINGKVRDSFRVSSGQAQSEVENTAKESGKVQKYLEGKKILKVVYVEGKVINFVVND